MKIRTDFVTNSSSASYSIELQLKSDDGAMASFKMHTGDLGTTCTVSDTRGEFESKRHAKEIELRIPREADGSIVLGRQPLSSTTSLDELIRDMLGLVSAHLYDGDWVSAFGIMPNANEKLAQSCEMRGITRDNLRIIGGKIWVMPWGDSLYEVSEYIDQWGINVQEIDLKHTGRVYCRRGGSPNWNPKWQALQLRGAIPNPTAENGKWWSEHDGRWMTIDEIRSRGPKADTYTSYESGHVR